MVIDSMLASGQLEEDVREKVREAMLKRHHHQNEKKLSNRIPLVRSFADIGKKHSDPHLLERNGEATALLSLWNSRLKLILIYETLAYKPYKVLMTNTRLFLRFTHGTNILLFAGNPQIICIWFMAPSLNLDNNVNVCVSVRTMALWSRDDVQQAASAAVTRSDGRFQGDVGKMCTIT